MHFIIQIYYFDYNVQNTGGCNFMWGFASLKLLK